MVEEAADEGVPEPRHPEPEAVRGSAKTSVPTRHPQAEMHVQAVARQVGERLGHERRQHPGLRGQAWTM